MFKTQVEPRTTGEWFHCKVLNILMSCLWLIRVKPWKIVVDLFFTITFTVMTSISIEVSQKSVRMIKRKQIKSFSWSVLLLNIALNQSELSKLNWTVKQFIFQGAKKVTFTACHSGKLKLTFTSPNIISTSPKNVLMSRLISQFLCNLDSSKNFTCLSGKLIREFTSPIAKPTSPWPSNTTFFAHCLYSTNDIDQRQLSEC